MPQNFITRNRRLYFLSDESRVTIFICLKNLSSSAGFKPANLGSNGKHDNHYTTDGEHLQSVIGIRAMTHTLLCKTYQVVKQKSNSWYVVKNI
jgi:hypothetical protein